MQPQTNNPQSPPSASPGQFDFMMKDQPKPPGRFSSLLPALPRTARIALAVVGGLFVLVILYSLFLGGKATNSDQLTAVAARAEEIARVSALVQSGSHSADTQGLAATTGAVMASQEQQVQAYLATNKTKVDKNKLAARLDKSTDAALATALQNNNYDQTYFDYLKANLTSYQNDLTTAYKGAGKKAQAILDMAYASVQALRSAPQLK
jgi:hypothetical protein